MFAFCFALCTLHFALDFTLAEEQPNEPLPLFSMPGEVHKGPLPKLTEAERTLAKALAADVNKLALEIGERNAGRFHYDDLLAAERFLGKSLEGAGYKVERQPYVVRGMEVANLIIEIPGGDKKEEIVVIGGHYDCVPGCPGANDNGSGTAATLAMARAFAKKKPARTLRFVLFVNEEQPWFQTTEMGSFVYASRCKERKENIVAMLSLETIGYYSDEKGSQKFDNLPPLRLLYPDTGNFIAFVADVKSGPLAQQVVGKFRETTKFPAYGCAMPENIPGVVWSDQWSFWKMGYSGLMVTDTAPFRYPHYHLKT
ncbi:MAG: M28 family peptidase, partial [Planctomycetales bacterium]|nr:M28 family peptidase [Planctomycetales bacterium]